MEARLRKIEARRFDRIPLRQQMWSAEKLFVHWFRRRTKNGKKERIGLRRPIEMDADEGQCRIRSRAK